MSEPKDWSVRFRAVLEGSVDVVAETAEEATAKADRKEADFTYFYQTAEIVDWEVLDEPRELP